VILPNETVVHRLGQSEGVSFEPTPAELALTPPKISRLMGGSPAEAIAAIRAVYSKSKKWKAPGAVATATVGSIRRVGFDVVADPTAQFPNHARLVHPVDGPIFGPSEVVALAVVF
jgi:hypothetical protein